MRFLKRYAFCITDLKSLESELGRFFYVGYNKQKKNAKLEIIRSQEAFEKLVMSDEIY
jgi:hypothetical protein